MVSITAPHPRLPDQIMGFGLSATANSRHAVRSPPSRAAPIRLSASDSLVGRWSRVGSRIEVPQLVGVEHPSHRLYEAVDDIERDDAHGMPDGIE